MTLFDYPPALPHNHIGYWGPVTATIDWCEENYILSPYIAEVVNSFTNFIFLLLGAHHLYSTIKNKFGYLYIFISIGFAAVGLGSFLFHMTLLYEYQLMDELPMVYVTALPFGYIFAWNSSKKLKWIWGLGTFITTLLFTYIYIFIYRNPEFHQFFYALLNFGLIYKTFNVANEKVTDLKAKKQIYKILILAFSLFAFGFLIWNLDFVFCPNLIFIRRNHLGLPFGILTEGHGWWHIFTGFGIYYFILYNQLLCTWMHDMQDQYELVWFGIFAEVRLKKDKKIN
ncbi:hypothetical protein CANARDRAFT_97527 [[Candida] arabinofermentans NRRL YB-2248]|uniref:Alkaline phytoceramidase n=1 Tax=[Candida] arabinofermentans NRRL YB-2248 TaxID=983967 RepID=A0A1E4T7B6_9ASCO|nr:hypothetical protein CANARDRAFT_97527 [[Candida] arabinofermentans NRRL YB-2248]